MGWRVRREERDERGPEWIVRTCMGAALVWRVDDDDDDDNDEEEQERSSTVGGKEIDDDDNGDEGEEARYSPSRWTRSNWHASVRSPAKFRIRQVPSLGRSSPRWTRRASAWFRIGWEGIRIPMLRVDARGLVLFSEEERIVSLLLLLLLMILMLFSISFGRTMTSWPFVVMDGEVGFLMRILGA